VSLLHRLWHDEVGFIATTDLILLATITVLGLIVGLVEYRNQVVQEFADLGQAVGHLNQSYTYEGADFDFTFTSFPGYPPGPVTRHYFVADSSFADQPDFGDGDETAGQEPPGISVRKAPGTEGTAVQPVPPYIP